MDIDEEDDPVEQEVHVYLSKQLAEQLHILQYPVRPNHLNYDDSHILNAKIKPRQSKFHVEMALNTHSHNYDRSKGEQIAINVDGPNAGVNAFYRSDKMDKQVLSSLPSGVSTKRYVVGMLKDGELHMTPVHSIVHMRPNFHYMDKADNKQKHEVDSQDEDEPAAQAVTVKFARRETDEAKARRLASYAYLSKKADEELWVPLSHHSLYTSLAESERNLLYAQNTNDESEFHTEQDEYLEKLIPKMELKETEKPAMPINVLSMADLKKMNISEQVHSLMVNAKVIGFNQLLSYMAKGVDPTAVLRALQQVALLVQGNWVVKSEVLYPKDKPSPHSGAPSDMLCRGRDYIMWRFTQNRCLVRKDITAVIKLHAEDVKEILEQMSHLKVKCGWEFVLDYDQEFVSRHPDVVQRQNMIWEAKFKQLSTVLKMMPVDLKLAAQAATANTTPPRRRRTVSRTKSTSGDRSMSDMSDDGAGGGAGRARRASGGRGGNRNRNSSGEGVAVVRRGSGDRARHSSGDRGRRSSGDRGRHSSGERSGAKSTAAKNSNSADNGLDHDHTKAASSDHADKNTDHSVTQNGPRVDTNGGIENETGNDVTPPKEEDRQNALVAFLRKKISAYGVLRLSEIRSLLRMELTSLPPGHALSGGITDKAIEDAAQLSDAVRILSAQILFKEPVFALGHRGDSLDVIRSALLDQLQKNTKVNTKALQEKVKETYPDVAGNFTDNDYKQVFSDYCERKHGKGSYYHVKGVIAAENSS